MNIETILKNMPTNFELKQLKPKLDIVKNMKLTDSNVSRASVRIDKGRD